MSNVKNNSASQDTRRRLLQAAGEVFADRGLHAATIKEITHRAGASLASVNYHFRDKNELYTAVLKQIGEQIVKKIPPDDQLTGSPETRVRQFMQWYLTNACDFSKAPWQQILIAREVAQPSRAFEWLLKDHLRPLVDKLSGLVAEILHLPISDEAVGAATACIFGQCGYFLRNIQVIGRLHPQLGEHPDLLHLASLAADFSLAGLSAFATHAAISASSS